MIKMFWLPNLKLTLAKVYFPNNDRDVLITALLIPHALIVGDNNSDIG